MKKNILNLKGVVTLTKQQQKSINGGSSSNCEVRCTPFRTVYVSSCDVFMPCGNFVIPISCHCGDV